MQGELFADDQRIKVEDQPSILQGLTISVRQPWAWLLIRPDIIGGDARARAYAEGLIKDIENRDWRTGVRGRVLIHASKGMTRAEYEDACDFVADEVSDKITVPRYESLERGGVIGTLTIVDCVTFSRSRWFCGEYGFAVRDSQPLPFYRYSGQLKFFTI